MGSRRRRLAGASAALAGGIASTVVGPAPASADNFGSTSNDGTEVSLGNNRTHSFSFWSVTGSLRLDTEWAITEQYSNPTAVNHQYNNNSTSADVRIYDSDYGVALPIAWVNCPSDATRNGSDPYESCFNQTLKFNNGAYPSYYNTQAERKFLACHEFGHTLGLQHAYTGWNHPDDANSCLRTYGAGAPYSTHQHDRNHLNQKYG